MRVNIDCSLILLLLSGMLALLKIGGQFPYSWIWVLAPMGIRRRLRGMSGDDTTQDNTTKEAQ